MTVYLCEPKKSEKLIKILGGFVNEGNLGEAQKTVKLLRRELTEEELIKILDESWNEDRLHTALDVAKLLPEPKRSEELTRILDGYLNYGSHWGLAQAQEAARLLGRRLTKEELTRILAKCLEKDNLSDAREVADLILG